MTNVEILSIIFLSVSQTGIEIVPFSTFQGYRHKLSNQTSMLHIQEVLKRSCWTELNIKFGGHGLGWYAVFLSHSYRKFFSIQEIVSSTQSLFLVLNIIPFSVCKHFLFEYSSTLHSLHLYLFIQYLCFLQKFEDCFSNILYCHVFIH